MPVSLVSPGNVLMDPEEDVSIFEVSLAETLSTTLSRNSGLHEKEDAPLGDDVKSHSIPKSTKSSSSTDSDSLEGSDGEEKEESDGEEKEEADGEESDGEEKEESDEEENEELDEEEKGDDMEEEEEEAAPLDGDVKCHSMLKSTKSSSSSSDSDGEGKGDAMEEEEDAPLGGNVKHHSTPKSTKSSSLSSDSDSSEESDGEEKGDAMTGVESDSNSLVQLVEPFEPRRSSRNLVQKNNSGLQSFTPPKLSSGKRKPALKIDKVLLSVSACIIP
jgi:hypothetical protein